MIPLRLVLSGFLSYQQTTELDFTGFDIACIVGPNGAGKSSLLDAITWALFGKARYREDGLINRASQAALVEFEFDYGGRRYRVRRVKHRNRPMVLDLDVWHNGHWRSLSESSLRDTQAGIEALLHMDYTTFVHASFFLQNQADRFAQATPAQRKDILFRILGLDIWKAYQERAKEERKRLEAQLEILQTNKDMLRRQLEEEPRLQSRLRETAEHLAQTEEALRDAEARLQEWEALRKTLEQQEALVHQLRRFWEEAQAEQLRLEAMLREYEDERARLQALLTREAEWQTLRRELVALRSELARWESLAEHYYRLQQTRQQLESFLRQERVRLETERRHLEAQKKEAERLREALKNLEARRRELLEEKTALDEQVAALTTLEARLSELQEEERRVFAAMQLVHAQQQTLARWRRELESHTGDHCPLCRQPLSPAHRDDLLAHWREEAERLTQERQHLQERLARLQDERQALETQRATLQKAQRRLDALLSQIQALEERYNEGMAQLRTWEKEGAPRLAEIERLLEENAFAPDVHVQLQEAETALEQLGYDPQAHAQAREAVRRAEALEQELQNLGQARGRLSVLEKELGRLRQELEANRARLQEREQAFRKAEAALQASRIRLQEAHPVVERVTRLREQHRQLVAQRGALEQQLRTLTAKREELKHLLAQEQDIQRTVAALRELEQAFGRDGVPALLLEQAIPLLENEANRLLEALTDGELRIALRTQRPLKSREGALRETLEIVVSDRYGERPYETFSGGEAFRINFALRMALARFLAQRAGAQLRFLVIDEGFGSQDETGRERLVEAIQAVRHDFAKILVITHLDELKERFTTRIEVFKTPSGSQIRVVGA